MSSFPIFEFIEIETTNTCNRQCSFCRFGLEIEKSPAKKMSWLIIDKIIDELNNLNYNGVLAWYSLNEPLLDKRIAEIIQKSKNNIPLATLALVTNGDLLNENIAKKLFSSGLDILRISVYDDITFEKAQSLMKIFPQIDYFEMRNPERISNRGGSIPNMRRDEKLLKQNCLHPSKNMVIDVTGKLKLCCDDLFSSVMPDNYSLTVNTLVELWNSQMINSYRNELKKNGRDNLELCKNCSFDSSIRWPE
jgi:organic radical activating enzyme